MKSWIELILTAVALGLALLSSPMAQAGDDAPMPTTSSDAPASGGAAAKPSDDDSGYVVEKKDGKTIKYKKKATYDFEGASIDGLYNKPSGSYISNIKDVKGKSIIRIRENFDAEVIDSGRLVK